MYEGPALRRVEKWNRTATPGDIYIGKAVSEGRFDPDKPCSFIGYFIFSRRKGPVRGTIYSAGRVQIGMYWHVLGAVPQTSYLFLMRDGEVWLHPKRASIRIPGCHELSDDGRAQWADEVARVFMDTITISPSVQLVESGVSRYHKIVRALVNGRILDCAALNIHKTMEDYAHGICPEWGERQLINTRHPTVTHATLVSLVLALEADKAAELIELAGLMEHKVPIISREASLAIYQQGCRLLARLLPAWWNRGYSLEWRDHPSIDLLFRQQYARILTEANERTIPMETITGFNKSSLRIGFPIEGKPIKKRASGLKMNVSNVALTDGAENGTD